MSNVTPIKIDTTDGRLPIKEKGLVFQEFLQTDCIDIEIFFPSDGHL